MKKLSKQILSFNFSAIRLSQRYENTTAFRNLGMEILIKPHPGNEGFIAKHHISQKAKFL